MGAMVGRSYLLEGAPALVVVQWRTGHGRGGPKNVLVRRPDGRLEVRPWWRGKRVS